ncbi:MULTISPECIES: DUF2505 domain-containing protein [Mycolicibacterium]|jgi:hypothetical protein|uniref:DUF2505 domain-containing protein n=2 Tax=Mycolicibacterium TaxID=1866885 RepID=A1T3B0_MYCVP|nr:MULTISPECIES: DUF2505 domain-containing protein [Mycolicibacterium]ABM11660.1 conserved hypothetical protein [Mycolicibacterium vanbaalenii PYR-1]MCV7126265.1 DUF2505 domain-containing protein [Mycolicibacterium vanbaalenii PYR-1]MDN4517504.1 DUF2505 domain-containing protein [Mycolicibacterium austroafricanum]MDW5612976.1 DUF2505 domain-containing protein [Mycolicibacterium sp. D5.8-2]PQP51986.1 DUF2505 domain-containing protein [Mycolicibacterium austroafricanum]
MPRSFDMATEYGGTVEQVHRAFSDEGYWLARLSDSGADHATLDAMVLDAAGNLHIKTTQTLRADRLPAVVTQFHRGDLSLVRKEIWTPVSEQRASAVVHGSIPGAPANLTGEAVLMPAGPGSQMQVAATIEVRVPLLGGKIENFIGRQLADLLTAEQRFTTVWITENR